MNRFAPTLIVLYLLAGWTLSVSFAQLPAAEDTVVTTIKPRPIEEISVVGQRSLARLRLRMDEKQQEIFSFFNAQNSSDRMDIICTRRRATGTNILKKECEPRFLRDLRVEKTRDVRLGIGVPFNQYDLVGWSAQDFERLQNEMLVLMQKNKEFARNMADLADLTENYDAHRKAMFNSQ